MANFLIKKENKNKEIVYMEYSTPGYAFTPKKNLYHLSNVKIIDSNMNDIIITTKFDNNFKKLIILVNNFLKDEDADSSDAAIILDEIELIKSILKMKYNKLLKKEKEEHLLKKLQFLEKEVKKKEILLKEEYLIEEERKDKSR